MEAEEELEEVIEDVEVTLGGVPSWKPKKKKLVRVTRCCRRPETILAGKTWWLWQVGVLEQWSRACMRISEMKTQRDMTEGQAVLTGPA